MPELPEVEFSARRLREWVKGHTLVSVEALDGTPLRGQSARDFIGAVTGATCVDVERVGKQLFLSLSNEMVILCHLGMTGKWRRVSLDAAASRWCRISLHLSSGFRLDFVDPRRFGRLRALSKASMMNDAEVLRLGPDALELTESPKEFAARVARGSRGIKVILMDQKVLAGVGNIYAAEALFLAGLNPWSIGKHMEEAVAMSLAPLLSKVMTDSLEREVGEEIQYLQEAKSENPFRVYGREGEACCECTQIIKRAQQHGRSTFWCPGCQS